METIHVYHSLQTKLNADDIEFCPHLPLEKPLFVCANYQLLEKEKKKIGCINVFSLDRKTVEMKQIQAVETNAVFDLKWDPEKSAAPRLAQASADGSVVIYALEDSFEQKAAAPAPVAEEEKKQPAVSVGGAEAIGSSLHLVQKIKSKVPKKGSSTPAALYIDWNNHVIPSCAHLLPLLLLLIEFSFSARCAQRSCCDWCE